VNAVSVTVTRIPSQSGTDMVRLAASWPAGGYGEWLVRLQGEDFSTEAELATEPQWSWAGYLPDGRYSLHVEGHEPAPFEVKPPAT
jgi:hypothetical protein